MLTKESNNPFIHYYSIDSIDNECLKRVELCDNITGETKWFLINSLNNTTPVFDNEVNIITLPNNSCLFVGEYNGRSNLYYVQGSKEDEAMYRKIDLSEEPRSITKYDNDYIIVKGKSGQFFYNLPLMKQTSDIFDNIIIDKTDDNNNVLFEKTIDYMNIRKKITGTVSRNGRIGNFVYDDLDHCIKSTPKISNSKEYDKLDNERILDSMKKTYNRMICEKEENVKKLIRINRIKKNDF